jgi:hypothetical protein
MSGNPVPPVDYDERVRRCITALENARNSPRFQGRLLVAPDVLDEIYSCLWQYTNFVSGLTATADEDQS